MLLLHAQQTTLFASSHPSREDFRSELYFWAPVDDDVVVRRLQCVRCKIWENENDLKDPTACTGEKPFPCSLLARSERKKSCTVSCSLSLLPSFQPSSQPALLVVFLLFFGYCNHNNHNHDHAWFLFSPFIYFLHTTANTLLFLHIPLLFFVVPVGRARVWRVVIFFFFNSPPLEYCRSTCIARRRTNFMWRT